MLLLALVQLMPFRLSAAEEGRKAQLKALAGQIKYQTGEIVLRGNPATFGVFACCKNHEGPIAETGQSFRLRHSGTQSRELVADASRVTRGRPERALLVASRFRKPGVRA